MQEVNLLKGLNHPNIVGYTTLYDTEDELILIMEYCAKGDLALHIKSKLSSNEVFTEAEIMKWFVELCQALAYIHSAHLIHRDIKPHNAFVDIANNIKLGDFGICRKLMTTMVEAKT